MLVSIIRIIIFNIVLAVAANKFDQFENQQITENEGKDYADEIGAIFKSTSAKKSIGITPLFQEIAEKIYELNNQSVTFDETMMKTRISYNTDDKSKKKMLLSLKREVLFSNEKKY